MSPMVPCLLAALWILGERAVYFALERVDEEALLGVVAALVREGRLGDAVTWSLRAPNALGRLLAAGLARIEEGGAAALAAMDVVALREQPRIEGRTRFLAPVAQAAALFGFLGTITGLVPGPALRAGGGGGRDGGVVRAPRADGAAPRAHGRGGGAGGGPRAGAPRAAAPRAGVSVSGTEGSGADGAHGPPRRRRATSGRRRTHTRRRSECLRDRRGATPVAARGTSGGWGRNSDCVAGVAGGRALNWSGRGGGTGAPSPSPSATGGLEAAENRN